MASCNSREDMFDGGSAEAYKWYQKECIADYGKETRQKFMRKNGDLKQKNNKIYKSSPQMQPNRDKTKAGKIKPKLSMSTGDQSYQQILKLTVNQQKDQIFIENLKLKYDGLFEEIFQRSSSYQSRRSRRSNRHIDLKSGSSCSVVDFDFVDMKCLQRNNIHYDGIDLNEFF